MESKVKYTPDYIIERLSRFFLIIAGLLTLLMVFTATYGVFRRYAFNSPEPYSYELSTMFLLFSFVLAVFTPQLLRELSLYDIYFSLHSSLFFYGLSMGAFAFLGREYIERRFGQVNFMVSAPILLPVKFKTAFFAFYS